jgi:hypothetical protein
MRSYSFALALLALILSSFASSQTSSSATTVPAMVKFSGAVQGAPSRILGVTFALYKDQQGGAPLWLETQSVNLDSTGHYTVQLGTTLPNGLPKELFTTGEARWLGVQAEGQSEQPRVLLLSVPYALKAADAETIGGLPPSAFVLASPSASQPGTATAVSNATAPTTAPPPNSAVTGLGTVNTIPLWDTTSDVVNSVITQSGTGTTAKIGINTATPTTTLDVKGAGTIRGLLTLPSVGVATAAKGSNSQGLNFTASTFSSTSNSAVNQNFRWQSEPAGNDTTTPSATMNLLFGSGTSQPAETGLKISNKGVFTFADGQTFPNTGTITGVSVGPGLSGGGTSGNISVSLTGSCGPGQVLQWTSVTWQCASLLSAVTAGTDLTVTTNNGNATVNLDTTQVPQLNVSNTFLGTQTVAGNLVTTGTVIGSNFQIGSNVFAFGSYASANAFLGFAGGASATGTSNTAVGASALLEDGTGFQNTAVGASSLLVNSTGTNNTATGVSAMQANTAGSNNTASGTDALSNNTTGNNNSALGFLAGPDSAHPALNNSTAIGALASVTASNSIVLGSISGINGAGSNTNVGIGTTAPAFTLDVHGTGNFTGPVTFAASQTFPNTISGLTAGTDLTVTTTNGNATVNLDTTKVPLLNASNSFVGNESVTGNVTASGNMTANGSINGSSEVLTGTGSILLRINQNSTSPNSFGIDALNVGPSGVGVYGQANDSNGIGVEGLNNSATGGTGVFGAVNNTSGVGVAVWGRAATSTASSIGVEAEADSATGYGLYATNTAGGMAALFHGGVQVTGDLATTGTATAGSYQIGSQLFAFGSYANYNAFLGFSGNTTSSGSYNAAAGPLALSADTSGTNNSAFGSWAMTANTSGSANTAVGQGALINSTTTDYNTAVGYFALGLGTGNLNTALGSQTMDGLITGNSNVDVGSRDLNSEPHFSGSFNTFIGAAGGPGGNLNVARLSLDSDVTLGAHAVVGDASFTNATISNATAIGANAEASQSNSLVLGSINGVNGAAADTNVGIGITAPMYRLHIGNGNSSFRAEGPATAGTGGRAASFGGYGDFGIDAPGISNGRFVVKESGAVGVAVAAPTHIFQVGQGFGNAFADGWSTYSSRRWKTNIQTLPNALAKVEQLRGVSYDLKGNGKHEIGVIAEEVGAVVPEIVTYEENGKDAQGVDYTRLTALLIEAVKQQQRQIQNQQQQIRTQQKQITRLTGKVEVLQTALGTTRQTKSKPTHLAQNDSPKANLP